MKRLIILIIFTLLCIATLDLGARKPTGAPEPTEPVVPLIVRDMVDNMRCRQWVDSVMHGLSLKEKVGQLFIYTIAPDINKKNRELLRKVVEDYAVGGLLFSGGEPDKQAFLTNEAQRMAQVPLLMTFDGEWGLAMRLKNMPKFPKNMALGCIVNDSLLYAYGQEVARQCHEMGVQVNFAPVADVNVNPDNPVINVRSFGEQPENVAAKVLAYARGLEDGGILSVCKHFPGHGDTNTDSHESLPMLAFSRERLDSVELYPFKQAIREGLSGIMVGHLEVPAIEEQSGIPSSLSRNVVFDLLNKDLRFRGLIFTDALAMKGVQEGNSSICLSALKAGNDLLLVPRRIKEEVEAVMHAIKHGELSRQLIEEKCRKVLTYKFALGLDRKPHVRLSGLSERINTPHAKQLIKQLEEASICVADNHSGLLPLDDHIKEIGLLHQGTQADVQPLLNGLKRYARVTAVAVPERPTAADSARICQQLEKFRRVIICLNQRSKKQTDWLNGLSISSPSIVVSFISLKELNTLAPLLSRTGALIQAHDNKCSIMERAAKLVYGKATAHGRLSTGIGTCYAAGDGLDYGFKTKPHVLPEDYGMSSKRLARLDSIAEEGIAQGAYPTCQIVVWKDGKEMYSKAFGEMRLGGKAWINTTDKIYDLASLTKTSATLLAVMKLYDRGKLNLSDRLGELLPEFKGTDKEDITIRQLLLHESGLTSTIFFYQEAIDRDSYTGRLFKNKKDELHPTRIARDTWANPEFKFTDGLTSEVKTSRHSLQVSEHLWIDSLFGDGYLKQIAASKRRDACYRYSCVGFITLQKIVEAISGMRLDAYLQQEFYGPMGLTHTGYLPLQFASKSQIVPSSIDSFLRKDTLQGFVHDESAAFQGGVSGNAGLFSNASEVAAIYQMILDDGLYEGKRYLSHATCRLFTTTVSKTSRRGLGFDKPDTKQPNRSPCCKEASAKVYGHTGFTGTCAWVDPDKRLVFVFLSNRTYPEAWNNKLMKLNIRPQLQKAMYQALIE